MSITPTIDLARPQRVHIVGIGGVVMNAIASVLVAMGHTVSGSDAVDSPVAQRLRAGGVPVAVGHDPSNIAGADVVAATSAVTGENPDVVAARHAGVPVLSRADVLAAICATRRTIAVAGTHGKTTTSSMLALILRHAGFDPSFIIGGEIGGLGTGVEWTDGDVLVVEADESDGSFLELPISGAIVTSVEPDHLEHYGGAFANLVDAFDRFLSGAPETRIVCADDPAAAALAGRQDARTYGESPSADFRITELVAHRGGTRFTLAYGDDLLGEVALPMLGAHNARNAAAAAGAAMELGAPFTAVREALAAYRGVARRMQVRGERDGVTYIDDYAHLPGEVRPALEAVASAGFDRVVCVFQPHRYSRTQALWRDFADAFDQADILVVTDIYAFFEAPRPGVSGDLIVRAVLGHSPFKRVAYLPERAAIAPYLRRVLRPGDVCLTLGAGDLTTLPDELLA